MPRKDHKPVEMHYLTSEERAADDKLARYGVLTVVGHHPSAAEVDELVKIFDHGHIDVGDTATFMDVIK